MEAKRSAAEREIERIRVPNRAAESPFALPDLMIVAPILSRVLLGATAPGLALQAAAFGAYAASSLKDWSRRARVRKIDFLRVYGSDVRHLPPMSLTARRSEIAILVRRVNEGYRPMEIPRRELAGRVNEALTSYIAQITGQRVETSDAVREFTLAKLLFPFALGGCDFISGDVAIFRETGIFEPHLIAHEFSHRKGYFKELEAQALAYLALTATDDRVLVQSALCERLHRQLRVVARREANPADGSAEARRPAGVAESAESTESTDRRYHDLVDRAGLRPQLSWAFHAMAPALNPTERALSKLMRRAYDERMKLTGQNGLTDYDEGFTRFLHATETGAVAR